MSSDIIDQIGNDIAVIIKERDTLRSIISECDVEIDNLKIKREDLLSKQLNLLHKLDQLESTKSKLIKCNEYISSLDESQMKWIDNMIASRKQELKKVAIAKFKKENPLIVRLEETEFMKYQDGSGETKVALKIRFFTTEELARKYMKCYNIQGIMVTNYFEYKTIFTNSSSLTDEEIESIDK